MNHSQQDIQLVWQDLSTELLSFIERRVGNRENSRDILQDVFIKVHQNIHQLKDCSKLTSWVYQITRRTILDHLRSQKQNLAVSHLPNSDFQSPDYQQLTRCIQSKIQQLPEKYREVILLTTFQQLKQTELADYLGISYSGTKSRVQRAKDKLKDLVSDCEQVEVNKKGKIKGHQLDY
ncbi:MAG: sigma-70 family RNA polymerase sigma factor [Saprospiraceae bacterium]